jgi:hypothetical protein
VRCSLAYDPSHTGGEHHEYAKPQKVTQKPVAQRCSLGLQLHKSASLLAKPEGCEPAGVYQGHGHGQWHPKTVKCYELTNVNVV